MLEWLPAPEPHVEARVPPVRSFVHEGVENGLIRHRPVFRASQDVRGRVGWIFPVHICDEEDQVFHPSYVDGPHAPPAETRWGDCPCLLLSLRRELCQVSLLVSANDLLALDRPACGRNVLPKSRYCRLRFHIHYNDTTILIEQCEKLWPVAWIWKNVQ